MSINVNDKNIGHATAYAYYKAGGGTMTEAEFTEFMADFGTASQTAVEAAQAALASKNAAQTAATTATNKASEATTAATTATNKAAEAQADADAAALDASQALSAASTATTKATEATTAAATAVSAKDDAVSANTAAQSAKTAAQTAQTGAETAAASVSASAAQIQTNADDISELKEDLTSEISARQNTDSGLNSAITTEKTRAKAEEARIEALFTAPTQEAVDSWLDEHPEATTTVQDGAITNAKLGSELQAKQATIINTYNEFVNAINDGDRNSSYVCKKITVDNPIQLTASSQCAEKSFSNGIFELNSNMFAWETPSNYHSSPNFVGCTFIGNGNSIFVDGAYTLGGNFVNCNFIDCAFVHNGTFVQSPKFINCYFENTVDNTFIHAEKAYDAKFISCRAEAQNKAMFIDAYGTVANTQTLNQITFAYCIIEGQSNYIVRTHDCSIAIDNCYTEDNSMPFIKVLASNRSANGILSISITDTKIDMPSGTNFVEIDSSYESSQWANFVCKNTSVSRGNLLNTNNLYYLDIEGITIYSGGTRPPSKELSKIDPQKNSIADFSVTLGHCIVKKFPCLITFDSSEGGWHTNLYFVSLSYNNTPRAVCLSDPTKKPSSVYDSETGYVDVTLHANRGVYGNSSAVLLNGLVNDLISRNAYNATYSGYNA